MDRPLEGLVVADFSRVLAGPLAASTLADLGATVIKVERPGVGDDTRGWGPPWASDASAYFHGANRSKRSIELDLDDAEDLSAAITLANRADILIENFVTGSLEKRGLGYQQLATTNPRLVYCSITGFGSGPGAGLRGYDFLVQAAGGLMSITGEPEQAPTKVGVALVDVLASKDATVGILAALRAREESGRGQRVEVNLLSSLLASLVNQASAYLTTGDVPRRMGNQHPSIAPYETLRVHDGFIAICCGNDSQFHSLLTALDATWLKDDPRFASNADRVVHRAELIPALEAILIEQSVDYWVERIGRAGVPVGRVNNIAEALDFAEELGLEPTVRVDPGAPAQLRNPVRFSGLSMTEYSRPPGLGEHNREIREWLAGTREL